MSPEELIRDRVRKARKQPPRLYTLHGTQGLLYVVLSESKPDTAYLLKVERGSVGCSCPDFTHRCFCKHAAALLMSLDLLPKRYLRDEPDSGALAPRCWVPRDWEDEDLMR